jgi:hypothetical protein
MGVIFDTQEVRPDDSIPFVVGWRYQIGNSVMGGQWVEIYQLTATKVYARGVDNNHADIVLPRWKFDDVVGDYFAP